MLIFSIAALVIGGALLLVSGIRRVTSARADHRTKESSATDQKTRRRALILIFVGLMALILAAIAVANPLA